MARFAVVLLFASLAFAQDAALNNRVMTSTCQTDPATACSGSRTVQATSADAFVDSIGTLWSPIDAKAPYFKKLTMDLGMRHVRSGSISTAYTNAIKDLASVGIKTQFVNSTYDSYAVDTTKYWSGLGQSTSLTQWATTNSINSSVVDVWEAPNELDVFGSMSRWHPGDSTSLSGNSSDTNYLGAYGVAYTKDLATTIHGNSFFAGAKVLGPAVGYVFPSPFSGGGANDLGASVDWGGCHPYQWGGNGYAVPNPNAYAGVTQYNLQTNQPSDQIDEFYYAFSWCNGLDVYGTKPLAPSESGYYTGTSALAVSLTDQAIYYPRIYGEHFRHGMPRSITYRFNDFIDANQPDRETKIGIIQADGTPKPAYFAMRSLITLLQEKGASFSPATLAYSVSVGDITGDANYSPTRKQYYHDLLTQKSDGDYYLLFWHEIARGQVNSGPPNYTSITGQATPLTTQPLPVTLTLPNSITSATLYTYDANWNYQPSSVSITSHQVSLNASDAIQVLRLSSKPAASRMQYGAGISLGASH